jgi:hypothetical protein
MNNSQTPYFYCDMKAIPPAERKQHEAITKELFRAVQATRELPNGYAFQFPNSKGVLIKIAEFIDRERLCCPFFSFAIEVEPEVGPIWLKLTGREGIKAFIQAEIGEALNISTQNADD